MQKLFVLAHNGKSQSLSYWECQSMCMVILGRVKVCAWSYLRGQSLFMVILGVSVFVHDHIREGQICAWSY